MIVVDTNVVAYFFIQGDRTEAARALWEREAEWVLPPLLRHENEVSNWNSRYRSRQQLESVPMTRSSFAWISHWALAWSQRINNYSACFLI